MLTNAKSPLLILASLVIGSIATYSMTPTLTPEVLLEIQNNKSVRDCITNINYDSWTLEIQTAIWICSKMEVKKITWTIWTIIPKANAKVISKTASPVNDSTDIRLRICKKVPTSPLCNEENFEMAKAIAYKKALIWAIADREEFFRVGIGIMNSESTLGTNYARSCDSTYNNFWGIKWRILDTGEAVHDQTIPQNGCYLYKFNTLEDYFGSKFNSLWKGYGKCFKTKDPVHCISGYYVWKPYSPTWISNVKSIAQ